MIKNFIFDMGSVLIDFNKESFLDKVGVFDVDDRKLLLNEIFNSLDWSLLDRGDIQEDDLYNRVIKVLPERLHSVAYKLIFNWDEPLVEINGMNELISDLYNDGYDIYLLSNASKRLRNGYFYRLSFAKYFKQLVVSGEIGMLKPNEEIYQYILRKYNLNPSECIFIDDLPINVEGAYRLGINGIVFHNDVKQLREKIKNIINKQA